MGYVMPLSAGDLERTERYRTRSHDSGVQAVGRDIGAWRHTTGSNRHLKTAKADPKVLSNWVVYDKPIYAMAAGTVVGAWRNAPDNTPGSLHAKFKARKFAGGGNHLWILQDDGIYALYAHAKPGSIPSALCPNNATLFTGTTSEFASPDIDDEVKIDDGARVEAGQFLGRIGNSGASEGGPHLHVHMEKDGKAMPMKFDRGMTTPVTGDTADLNGPWTKVKGNALPEGSILIWPPRPRGNYTFNGTPAAEFQSLFDHLSDSGMMPDIITCKNDGATYDAKWIPGKGSWRCHPGMTAADAQAKHALYTKQGYKRTSSYTCGSRTVAVWRK